MLPATFRWKTLGQILLFILVCQAAGLLGVLTTPTGETDWYQGLAKPAFNPPSWVFGPVWTLLYTLMGYAAYRIWDLGTARPNVRTALALFAGQLVLNAAWTPVFFGAESLAGGAVIIVALWVALGVTTWAFFRLDRPAGALLVPYLLWVTYAAVLNLTIWSMNA